MLETFTLPAGTICKRNGIPFALVEDTKISTHPGNIGLVVEDEPKSVGSAGGVSAASGSACTDSHRSEG